MNDDAKVIKRRLRGLVISNKSDQTIVVKVERRFKHPIYSKFITQSKKYHAHDNENKANVGDVVTIIESKPFSKMKRWELISIN